MSSSVMWKLNIVNAAMRTQRNSNTIHLTEQRHTLKTGMVQTTVPILVCATNVCAAKQSKCLTL